MGKKSLENFCKKLFVDLTDVFIFYIPDSSVMNESIKESNAKEFKSLLQKVIIMDWHKGPLMYVKDTLKFSELEKSALLSKNILRLIDKKEKLKSSSFEYIFDKYYNQVCAMNIVAGWLNDQNRLERVDDKREKTVQAFWLQQLLFESHQSELEKVFCSSNKTVNSILGSDKLELQLPILLDQLNKIESNQLMNNKIVERLVGKTQVPKENSITKFNPLKKKLLITEVEAEEYLLKAVFNLSL